MRGAPTAVITSLGKQYVRYGYRRITAMLRQRGWQVNAKPVARRCRVEGRLHHAQEPAGKRV